MRSYPSVNLNSKKLHIITLAATWLVMHVVLVWQYGIVTSFEATKYISEADNLLRTGSYSSRSFLFYSTQILLIAASKGLHVGYVPVIAIQLLLNIASTYCFYRIVEHLTRRSNVAFFFTLALVSMYYYQLYNVYLFTESIYFSISILYFYRLVKMIRLGPAQWAEIGLFLVLLYFTRPVGMFFIPATFVFLVLKFYQKKAVRIFFSAGVLLSIFFFLLVNYGMNSGGEFNFLLPYLEKQVICGLPSGRKNVKVPVDQNSIQGLFYILDNYPRLFITLFCKRLFTFFGLIRPYYSIVRNISVAWFFYTLYLYAFKGLRKQFWACLPELAFSFLLIFFATLTVGLSCDEGYNRFIYAILPFLMVMASLAFASTEKINKTAAPEREAKAHG